MPVRWAENLSLSCVDLVEMLGASTSCSPKGLPTPVQGQLPRLVQRLGRSRDMLLFPFAPARNVTA